MFRTRPHYPEWFHYTTCYRQMWDLSWRGAFANYLWIHCIVPDSWKPLIMWMMR